MPHNTVSVFKGPAGAEVILPALPAVSHPATSLQLVTKATLPPTSLLPPQFFFLFLPFTSLLLSDENAWHGPLSLSPTPSTVESEEVPFVVT